MTSSSSRAIGSSRVSLVMTTRRVSWFLALAQGYVAARGIRAVVTTMVGPMIAGRNYVLIRLKIPSVAATDNPRRFVLFVGIVVSALVDSRRPKWLLVLLGFVLCPAGGVSIAKVSGLLLWFYELAKDR